MRGPGLGRRARLRPDRQHRGYAVAALRAGRLRRRDNGGELGLSTGCAARVSVAGELGLVVTGGRKRARGDRGKDVDKWGV